MIGDTITITLDGSGGSAHTANKINQDSYAAEYLHKGATYALSAKVRHSKETPKAGSLPMDRHNVTFTQRVYAVGDTPEKIREAYVVIRNNPDDTVADVTNLVEALTFWLTDTMSDKIVGWES